MFQCEIFNILFSCEDEDIGRFSNLHWCTFKSSNASVKILLYLLVNFALRRLYRLRVDSGESIGLLLYIYIYIYIVMIIVIYMITYMIIYMIINE